jgi:hypothetical protein
MGRDFTPEAQARVRLSRRAGHGNAGVHPAAVRFHWRDSPIACDVHAALPDVGVVFEPRRRGRGGLKAKPRQVISQLAALYVLSVIVLTERSTRCAPGLLRS